MDWQMWRLGVLLGLLLGQGVGTVWAQTATLSEPPAMANPDRENPARLVPANSFGDKKVIGWIEAVRLYPGALHIIAKIDTGADSTSVNAEWIKEFTRDGKRWVRFQIHDDDGDIGQFERPVLRTVKIKRHFGQSQRRLVVRLGLCIDGRYALADVNLVDRKGFKYQALIGRRDMKDRFLVDPGRKNLSEPECKGVQELE